MLVSGVATEVARRGRVPPLTTKKMPKIEKKREKSGKIRKKEEKSGRTGKNREVSFTLPLLTDTAGYATDAGCYVFLFLFLFFVVVDKFCLCMLVVMLLCYVNC